MARQSVPSGTTKRPRSHAPQPMVENQSDESNSSPNRRDHPNDDAQSQGSNGDNHPSLHTFDGTAGENGMPSDGQELPTSTSAEPAPIIPSELYVRYRSAMLAHLERRLSAQFFAEVDTPKGLEDMVQTIMQITEARLYNVAYYNVVGEPADASLGMMGLGHFHNTEVPFINGYPEMQPQQGPPWEAMGASDLNSI